MKKRLLKLIEKHEALSQSDINRYYKSCGKYDNSFVINMLERKDRLKKASETLKKMNINFTRFVAIVGKKLTESKYAKQFNILRPGELGCLLSHLSIAALAANHPAPNSFTIIFEDDIVSNSQSIKHLFSDLDEIDKHDGVDIIYFGKCLESCGKMIQVKNGIYRAVAPSCCHAYAIKNSFAKKLFNDLDHCLDEKYKNSILNADYFNRGIDSIYGDYIINGMATGLVLHPAVFYQDVLFGGSDLRDKFMINYQECNDTNPPCQPCEKEPEKVCPVDHAGNKRKRTIIIGLIILIVVIIIVWQRHLLLRMGKRIGKTKFITRGWYKYGLVILGLLVVIGILIGFNVKRLLNNKEQASAKPDWLKSFDSPPNEILDPLIDICDVKAKNFKVEEKMLYSTDYKVFNPNGLYSSYFDAFKRRNQIAESHNSYDDKKVFLSTSRCFNGRVSYPLLQIYNNDLTKILESKRIKVESHRSMKSRDALGYEDMRIFQYRGKDRKLRNYIIGVNLDRSPVNLPSMILVELDHDFNTRETWHLRYKPVANLPNKNWSPLTLPCGDLGFIVDIDPLLIVKRKRKNHSCLSEKCELAYTADKQTNVNKVRNSSITYNWEDVPEDIRSVLKKICGKSQPPEGYKRYVLLGHTKYVESDFVLGGWLVLYQHYFAIIDLPIKPCKYSKPKIYYSNPFHIEKKDRPHIEYVSGLAFRSKDCDCDNTDKVIIMYGMEDKESKYIILTPNKLRKLLSANTQFKPLRLD